MTEEQSGNFENVMVIDDNLIDLYIAAKMITRNNFGKKVLQYSSAIEALKYLQENLGNISGWPNVMFVDIYMPGMSGFEFMLEYEKLPAELKNYCKVFIISSSVDKRDIAKANNDINVIAMKEKPITKDFLNDVMSSYKKSLS